MFHQDSDEVTFDEASVYFSEEDWTLLQEWQKELCSNVMKDIQQAFVSLGPLIATTLCSLRAKEKENLLSIDSQDLEQKHIIDPSPGDTMGHQEVLRKINTGQDPTMNNSQDCEETAENDPLSPGFPFPDTDVCPKIEPKVHPIFIDHLGAEIRESSIDTNSGYDVISYLVKDNDDAYYMDPQESRKLKQIDSLSGNGSRNIRKKVGESIKYSKQKMHSTTPSFNMNPKEFQSPHEREHCRDQLCSEGFEKRKRENVVHCEDTSTNSQPFVATTEWRPKGRLSKKCNEFENNPTSSQVAMSLQHIQQNRTSSKYSEVDKSFSIKQDLVRHMGARSKGRPYACTDCGKTFLQKGKLIIHYRIHTGEKPYPCTFCHKRFSRKDYLDAHIRTHTGERPYKCTECEKRFTQKGELNLHRRKHT